MDLFKIIQDLRAEQRRIERAIAAIEELATGTAALTDDDAQPEAAPPAKKRRGRPRKDSRPSTA